MLSTVTTAVQSGRRIAEQQICRDLMNALLAEQFFPLDESEWVQWDDAPQEIRERYSEEMKTVAANTAESEHSTWWVYVSDELLFLAMDSIRLCREWVANSPVYVRSTSEASEQLESSWQHLHEAGEIADRILSLKLTTDEFAQPGVAEFITGIRTAVQQLSLSLNPESLQTLMDRQPESAYEWYVYAEQVAALRDRPFHPSSKAKTGFSEQDCLDYAAEFGTSIPLRWLAVQHTHIQQGKEGDSLMLTDLLSDAEQQSLHTELRSLGLSTEQYMLLPVHPWQLEHVILPRFASELEQRILVVLTTEVGHVQATSSLRSMAPKQPNTTMLKLPVSVLSLGAARYLPVVKLLNGLSGERMLRQAVECDAQLQNKVWLCHENHWWGYMPSDMGLYDDHPRHLAAQLRLYPEVLLDEQYRIVPMAALGVQMKDTHLLTALLGRSLSATEATTFYRQLSTLFYDVVMRLFTIGVVPEIHGQNCCVVLRDGVPHSLLFRDHDSVRLHPPYTEKHGIADPQYHIRPGYSNSLYNETLEKLIFYVQSLGTQVNLAAIMESLSEVYGADERQLWQITSAAWQQALDEVDLPEDDRELLHRCIFQAEQWPTKLIVRPLLEADGVPGAMPSGKGKGHNPFYRL
ncbi:IucA/IucC family protein [Paenibacillus kandeliae]|uniref:IucA/IucC family protein n=1 Tax=Paenibacillus kandeliae TaxID=3231269 RepID=UPI0034582BFC